MTLPRKWFRWLFKAAFPFMPDALSEKVGVTMVPMTYEPGDHIKVEFEGEDGMPGEWMWCVVRGRDDERRLVFCTLDNEPLNDYRGKVRLGSELAVSYDRVREHRKPSEFTTQ